jgi:hypothetical protein
MCFIGIFYDFLVFYTENSALREQTIKMI